MGVPYTSDVSDLVLGEGVSIGSGSRLAGGRIVVNDGCRIGRNVEITVTDELVLGKNSKIGDYAVIRGGKIRTDREFYTNHHAEVGGGSCFDPTSALLIGHWFHLGRYRSHAIIKTAMPVDIGNEVGLGRRLIEGKASKMSERARELLRRHGIRFRVDTVDNAYTPWAQG